MINRLSLIVLSILTIICQTVNGQNCNCSKYLYLNDTGLDFIEKFKIDPNDGSLTEIGDAQNGMPWLNAAGIVDDPHAIASDLNGNLYIGENDQINNEYNIQKFSCIGQKIDANLSTPAIDNFANDGFSFNHFSIGNLLYTNIFSDFQTGTGNIIIYDLCTGNQVGCMREGYFWGFNEGNDGYWYATGTGASGGFQGGIYRGLIDPAAYTDGAGGCGSFELFLTETQLGVPFGSRIMGIDQDASGNFYIAVSAGGGFNPPSYIQKLDVNGNVIAQSLTDTQFDTNLADNLNWAGSRGVTYNNGYVYVSSGDDCIAVFESTNLNYEPALSNNIIASFPKQIGLLEECCPINNPLTIDTLICNGTGTISFLLQDILNCNSSVCEGEWSVDITDPNVTYDACENSIAVNLSENTCTSYTLTSDGMATNNQCGQFTININFETASITSTIIEPDQTICQGGVPQPLVAISSTAGVVHQWQSSTTGCNGSFTNIPNASNSTYAPPALNQTTYYRAITSLPGTCSDKSCSTTSNCITITTDIPPPRCINEFGEFTIQKRRP